MSQCIVQLQISQKNSSIIIKQKVRQLRKMGATQSQATQSNQDLLLDFTQVRKQGNGVVLADKKSESTYFLKQFNYINKKQYQEEFKRLQALENQPQNQNILFLVRLFSQTYNNICSNSYKIYALYEYPTITLEQEIEARKKQQKYFQQCQLWSILQSCANALSELKPSISLHPKNIFIIPDGVLKIINNEMIDEDYRCYIKQSVYYAPQKIKEFKKCDNQNSLRKQSIFSLGMTLLHAALLQPVHSCYNYQNYDFANDRLEKYIEELVNAKNIQSSQSNQQNSHRGRYSEDFIQMLAMILQPNPNKRASLMEVHGMLNKIWNTETEQENTKNNIEQEQQQQEQYENKEEKNNGQEQSAEWTEKVLQMSNKGKQCTNSLSNKKYMKNSETKQPSEVQNSVSHPLNQNKTKGQTSEQRSMLSSFYQSERQSKVNINDYNTVNPNHLNKFLAKPTESVPEIVKMNQPAPIQSSQTFSVYNHSNTLITAPISVNTNPLMFAPSTVYPTNKQNGLYTDPKLLEMIRKDLQDLNELKKSSMINTYVPYSNPYIGTSSYFSSYADIGAGVLSSKSSIGLVTPSSNVQQIYSMNTENNYSSPKIQNVVSMNNLNSASGRSQQLKPQSVQASQPSQVPQVVQPQQKQQGFSKGNQNAVFVIEEYEDGRKFEGTLVNGQKQGHGKLIYSDGAYYQGQFKNDKMEGEGTLFYGPNRPAYEGHWVADQFHGFGTLFNESPLQLNGCFNYNDFNLIEDFWVRYQGNFDCDNKSGEGKLVLSNGEQFQGIFQNDCINGKGVFLTKDGQEITGVWEENILVQLDA